MEQINYFYRDTKSNSVNVSSYRFEKKQLRKKQETALWSKLLIMQVILVFSCFNSLQAQGFLHRDNKKIVNGNGEEVILRGIGIGGWMIQEPYMFNISATNQKDIRKKIENLIGKQNTDTFYRAWHINFVQKSDIDSLAKFGFNSIRLVMHYNLFTLPIEQEPVPGQQTWLQEGFDLVDSVLKWCTENHIYVILDLHAAPGGQGKDAAISDYDATLPSLWESDANKAKILQLWKKLAAKYKNEPWIGGYDLINEPNWDFENSGNANGCNCSQNKPLANLYKALIDTIRKEDTVHMIIVEGNCWGNNYNGLQSIFSYDQNLAVSFHKYWNYNDKNSIQGMLNIRNNYNVPLWCGESGENSDVWYTQAISLLENNDIGWSWWTLKKNNSLSGIMSILPENDYTLLTNYWKNGGTKPDTATAKNALMKQTEKIKIENCSINYSVLDAMFRQVTTTETRPFANTQIPGIIFAANYDYGRNGYAYFDTDTADYHVSTGTYGTANAGGSYRNDGVDIEKCTDSELTNGYSVGWTAAGEWLKYTVNISQSGAYKLCVRQAGTGSQINLTIDNKDITGTLNLPPTGGWQTWKTDTFYDILLNEGRKSIKLNIIKAGSNFNYIKLLYSKPQNQVAFKIVSAQTDNEGKKIIVNLNKSINNNSFGLNDWKINKNSQELTIVTMDTLSNQQIVITLNEKILYGDAVTLTYSGNSIVAIDNTVLESASQINVTNCLPYMFRIPAKIEAESYYQQSGLSVETCNEGGQDMGYTNAGDYLDYLIIVTNAGKYNVQLRVAALNSGGVIELQLFDDNNNKTVLKTINIQATGGWQTWKTISDTVNLPAGAYKLRVYIKNPEFNINWLSFSVYTKIFQAEKENSLEISPNPCSKFFTISNLYQPGKYQLTINDLQGKVYTLQSFIVDNASSRIIDISNLIPGIYIIRICNDNNLMAIKKLIVM
jgi:hypothetical protein